MNIGSGGIKAAVNTASRPQEEFDAKKIKASEGKELMDACVKLEGEFMKIMLKEMKKTIPDSKLLPKTAGHDMVQDMYYESIGEDAAKNSSLGLAKMMYEQFANGRSDKK